MVSVELLHQAIKVVPRNKWDVCFNKGLNLRRSLQHLDLRLRTLR